MMNGARRHTRRGSRQHNKISCRGVVAKGPTRTPTGLGLSLSGGKRWARPSHIRTYMSYCTNRRDSGLIHNPMSFGGSSSIVLKDSHIISKYQELKANTGRLNIETGSPILTDK
ncbi:hypothetical protein M9H77_17529 [Catharanthus roseus]|uniref:Uncharacterized protein n=1 Tax=Catharanthus roseus TaxID=4058 RepID=A0ACC0B4W6_CATRO|nr:hypothetical protein M9H77_17529 [Catharanthus roseus]